MVIKSVLLAVVVIVGIVPPAQSQEVVGKTTVLDPVLSCLSLIR
jgi:hypothetical protein